MTDNSERLRENLEQRKRAKQLKEQKKLEKNSDISSTFGKKSSVVVKSGANL